MPIDARLVERIREQLAGRRGVVEKRLIGTHAFMVNGSLCCTVGPKGLLVRIPPADRDALLALPHVGPMTMGHGPRARTMSGFVRIEPAGVKTRAALAKWLERGIAAGAAKQRKATSPTRVAARRARGAP